MSSVFSCSSSLLHSRRSYRSLSSRLWFTWTQMFLMPASSSWCTVLQTALTRGLVSRKWMNMLTLSLSTWKMQLRLEMTLHLSLLLSASSSKMSTKSMLEPSLSWALPMVLSRLV